MNSRRIRFALPIAGVLGLAIASLALAGSQDHGKGNGKSWGKDFKVDVKVDFKGNGWGKNNRNTFTASLSGHNEVPAIHTKATGRLSLTINADNTMSFELTYSGLAAGANAAHVHFGQPGANGGVAFFFCGGGGKPACPAGTTSPATVTGTIAAADVQAIPTQGLAAGDLAGIVEEIKAGFAYANVHNATYASGEIRGQLDGKRSGRGHDDDDDD